MKLDGYNYMTFNAVTVREIFEHWLNNKMFTIETPNVYDRPNNTITIAFKVKEATE